MSDKVPKTLGKSPTLYVEGETPDGKAVVGVWNLHVRIATDDDCWFAQGFEIDYSAQGDSLADVKARFQHGLGATIHEHLKLFGTAEGILKPAPPEVWKELVKAPGSAHTHSQIGIHELFEDQDVIESFPFHGIEYQEPIHAA